jgi:peptidoglycan/xylan/chitin deacetylase (PgdA/CDA1 family)
MRIVSPVLKRVVYPSMAKTGLFRRLLSGGLAVVTYHGVLPDGYQPVDPSMDGNLISAEILRRQLRLLKAHYNVISPQDFLAWLERRCDLPRRAVLLTCDDGLLNCLTDMLPVLQQESVRCLFFLTGASASQTRTMLWYEDLFLAFLQAPAGRYQIPCGEVAILCELGSREARRASWWSSVKLLSQVNADTRSLLLRACRAQLGLSEQRDRNSENAASRHRFDLLTAAELCELTAAGMTIGAHTLSHPMLSQAPPELAYTEIAESRARLEHALKQQVWAFAYPFGDAQSVTPQVLGMPSSAGFAAAFLNFGGGLGTALPKYAMPRVHVTAAMSLSEFEAHVSGFYAWMQRRMNRNSTGDS